MCQIAQRRRGREKRRDDTVVLALTQCRDNERPLYCVSQWGVVSDLSVLVRNPDYAGTGCLEWAQGLQSVFYCNSLDAYQWEKGGGKRAAKLTPACLPSEAPSA